MAVDPAFSTAAALALGLLFVASAVAKLRDPQAFVGTVANYRLLPMMLAAPAAWVVIGVELVVAVGLFLQRGDALAAAGLMLAGYAVAMGVNLLRGRTHIDCGCLGFGGAHPTIGWDLVGRNLLLASAALATGLLPRDPRALGAADWISILGAVVAGAFIYLCFEQLSAIKARARMVRA